MNYSPAILIDDYLNNERYYLALSEGDMAIVDDNWENRDILLVDLSNTTVFRDLTRWYELKPFHFKILITRNFIHLDGLKVVQKHDPRHPVVRSLKFLIGGLIKCLVENASSRIEFLKITRMTAEDICFDYHASLLLHLENASIPDKGLRVVVDNTKEEQE